MKKNLSEDQIFIIHKSIAQNHKEMFELSSEYYSQTPPESYADVKVVFFGDLYNKKQLKRNFDIKSNFNGQIVAELYKKIGIKVAEILVGNYSVVIGTQESLIFFKDYFGLTNLFFYNDEKNNILILSTKIVNIKKKFPLHINKEFLPRYFLLDQSLKCDTPFNKVNKVCNYQVNEYNFRNFSLNSYDVGKSPFNIQERNKVSNTYLMERIEDLLEKAVNELIGNYENFNILNMMSGGIDSSYISVILRKKGFVNSICASFLETGSDAEYSNNVAEFLKLNHNTISINGNTFYNGITNSISASEMPYGFQGESIFYNIFEVSKTANESNPSTLLMSGQGSDGLFSFGRESRILNYLNKIPFPADLTTHFLPKKYRSLAQRLNIDNKNNYFSEDLIEDYLGVTEYKKEKVKSLLGVDHLNNLVKTESKLVNKYNISLIKKIHVLHSYYGELIRIPNILNSMAKNENLTISFPFLYKELFEFVQNIDIGILIKGDGKKYHLRKLLAQNIPSEFVYRKKISMNIPFIDIFTENQLFKNTIKEIEETSSDYLNISGKNIFKSSEYSWLWLKIINLHLWKKQFIDN